MPTRTLLCFTLLLSLSHVCAAQTAPQGRTPGEEAAPAEGLTDAVARRREALLAELRALEAESKELLKPLDAAAARAEITAAAWTLDRAWAQGLLREALALTFPAEVDRARLRERPIGAALQPGPAEDAARARVRRRVFHLAARVREFARELNNVSNITQTYPPLLRRLAKEGDAGRVALLADEVARRLRAAAERSNSNDSFVPTLLAPVAGSIRIYKQSRALEALGEIALAVEPAAPQSALDLLDALAETAAKARVTSEHGGPNFNPDAFARLSAHDAGRVRAAAARLEDRPQRIAALAAVCRGEAERLEKKNATR